MADQLQLVIAEFERRDYLRILFDNARRSKARRNADLIGVVLDNMADRMYAAVHGACRAEIYPARLYRIFRRFGNDAHKLVNAVVFRRSDRHNGYAQPVGQLLNIHAAVVAQKLIHHIQRQNHGLAHLDKLQREIKVALYIRRVNDVYYRIRLALDYKIARYLLLAGIRADGIYAGKIDKVVVLPSDNLADLVLDRNAGKISDVLI